MVHKMMFRHALFKSYQPKSFDVIFSGRRVINRATIRLLQHGAEYIFLFTFFCLPGFNAVCSVKRPIKLV